MSVVETDLSSPAAEAGLVFPLLHYCDFKCVTLPSPAEALPDEYVLPAGRPVPDLCSKGGSALLMSDLGPDF